MAFASLTANLNLNIANFSSRLASASQRMNAFASSLNDNYGRANAALHKHSLGLKDTARIVQGIMVSQAFYAGAQAISGATKALMDFNEQLDYAQVTYSALFNSTDKANNFTKVLQEHSVNTIFDYQELAAASKKMLAYGIEYENLMYVMEGLTNLGAMSGDTAAMDRIALALGQIQTTGYLAATEMRQLANAYVPIYDIVQDSFGLTGEQMKNVGDLKIPAYQVINAIVDYANEKFGSVGDAAMLTITGLKNRIVDTMKVMGSEMMMPLTVAWKSFLAYVADGLSSIRSTYASGGWGGLFESLVPDPATQTTVRAFFANLHNLIMTVASALSSVMSILGVLGQTFMITFNLVAPVIMGVVNALAATVRAISENAYAASVLRTSLVLAAGAFVVLKVQAMAATVVTAVTNAVIGLSKALLLLAAIVAKHPILMLIAGIGIALTGLAAASNNANNSLSSLFKNISGIGGNTNQDDIFKKVKDNADGASSSIDELNNRLTAGSGSAEELADGIGGAGKAAKDAKKTLGLLSFDEVFKLPDPKEDSGSGGGGYSPYTGLLEDLGNIGAGFAGIGDALLGDIPDFGEYIDAFTDNLFGGISESIVDKLKDTAIGALLGGGIGALLGGLLGGPGGALIGAKIGALAGGIVGLFWDHIKEAFGFTDTAGLAALVPGALGMALGFTAFGVPGAILGGAIGALASNLVSMIWQKIGDAFGRSQSEIEFAQIASSLAAGIGGIIGFIIGGPAGALIGAGIGTLVGGMLGMFRDSIIEIFKSFNIADALAGAMSGAMLGLTTGNPLFALMGSLGGFVMGGFFEGIDEALSDIGTWLNEHVFTPFITWFKSLFIIQSPSAVMHEMGVFTIQGFLNGLVETWALVGAWLTETLNTFSLWYEDLKIRTLDALSVISSYWTTKWNEIKTWAVTQWESIKEWFATWYETLKTSTISSLQSIKSSWQNRWIEIKSNAVAKWTEMRNEFITWWTNLKTDTTESLEEIKAKWAEKWDEIKAKLSAWWDDMKTSMENWLEEKIWAPIAKFFDLSNFWGRISGLLDAIRQRLSDWWDSVTSMFSADVEVEANASVKSSTKSSGGTKMAGHAMGGIFNREHIARFAEGNKAEMAIPLENASAMQPFVNAISQGILEGLAPTIVQNNSTNSNNLPPMYVGTLIADERGLKQLYKKFEIIQLQENARKGNA